MKKKIIKIVAFIGLFGAMYALYLFNLPHRNAKDIESEFTFGASELALQFVENPILANETYLSDDGDSKVGVISGIVFEVGENVKGEQYAIIRNVNSVVGVQCSFLSNENLEIGDFVSVKGVIRSGAEFDEDFEEYIDVIMEQCVIIK
jgi:hypothetical protein